MKRKILLLTLLFITVIYSAACTKTPVVNDSGQANADKEQNEDGTESQNEVETENNKSPESKEKTLIAYFSATGHTKNAAEQLSEAIGADMFEIVPAVQYTSDDLDYTTDCRANREQNDPESRPAIAERISDISKYDTIIIGYPIWHGQAPKIIYTFLESYDFSNKTIIPFCTSGSSPIGNSAQNLKNSAPNAVWKDGIRLGGNEDGNTIKTRISELGMNKKDDLIKITVGSIVMTAKLSDNSSAEAFRQLLAKGPLTIRMSDYGEMEKVGPIGSELPRNDEQISTDAGDIILYQGNSIVIYYDKNSWSFTRIGKINDITQERLKAILGSSDVDVTFSLN